jgi:hypothetical protein
MSIEGQILEHVIKSLNSLEGGAVNNTIMTRNKDDANELKGYLNNYNVKIDESIVTSGWYVLTVSKKESK